MADFGITSEASSKTFRPTNQSRGTSGYRAPELLIEEAVYNNKVDIWSMGCILYELALVQKAFSDDYAAIDFKRSKKDLSVTLDETFSEQCKDSIVKSMKSMLRTESSSRPSAADLFDEFSRNCQYTEAQFRQTPETSGPDTLNISLKGSDSICAV